jgi:hypothetical protein
MRLEDIADETGEAIDTRRRVVDRARSYLAPDGGPCARDPNEFFRLVAPMYADRGYERSKSWCGIFALSCLVLENLWPADAERWRDGSGFVLRGVADGLLRVTKFGKPGDVVVFGAPLWHHAIVEVGPVAGKVQTIDGNVLGPVEGCARKTHAITGATTFYSIAPLVGGVP